MPRAFLGLDAIYKPRGFRVHQVRFGGHPYSWDIDAHSHPLCPGKAMIKPSTPCLFEEFLKLHEINGWELIPAERKVRTETDPWSFIDAEGLGEMFHEARAGDKALWYSFNDFMLDPNMVFVDELETASQEHFYKLGFEVIPVPFWEVGAFGGYLHCATVDDYREGECEDYFPKQIDGY
jgi:glycine amidinotransferase